MPIYEYVCDNCREVIEIPAIGEFGCPECNEGELRRLWRSVNVNTANLRAARG